MDRFEQIAENLKEIIESVRERDRWMSVPKAAEHLGVPKNALLKWCKEGRIVCRTQTDGAKHIHYKVDTIETKKWLAAGGVIGDLKKLMK